MNNANNISTREMTNNQIDTAIDAIQARMGRKLFTTSHGASRMGGDLSTLTANDRDRLHNLRHEQNRRHCASF